MLTIEFLFGIDFYSIKNCFFPIECKDFHHAYFGDMHVLNCFDDVADRGGRGCGIRYKIVYYISILIVYWYC